MRKFKGAMMTSEPNIITGAIKHKQALDSLGIHYEFTNVDPMHYHADYTLSIDEPGYSNAKELHDELVQDAVNHGIILVITTEEISC